MNHRGSPLRVFLPLILHASPIGALNGKGEEREGKREGGREGGRRSRRLKESNV